MRLSFTHMCMYVIGISVVCTRMSSVCHSSHKCLYVMVCHSYVLVCNPHVTRIYSYVIRMSTICSPMSPVCHSYVLVCHAYVTRLWFYYEVSKIASSDFNELHSFELNRLKIGSVREKKELGS